MQATVKDVMSTDPVSATAASSFKEIAARLRELRVSALPVLDREGRVIGVVSAGDLLAKEALDGGSGGAGGKIAAVVRRKALRKAAGVTAGDLMSSPAVTVAADDTVEHAARLMYDRNLKRLPVVDAAGQLVGIISRTDVLAVFDRPDEEIRREIVGQVIPRLSEPSWYWVIVKDGIVTLEGTPETTPIGREVLARVRHVQGVVAVRDRLVYPLPPDPVAPNPYFRPHGHLPARRPACRWSHRPDGHLGSWDLRPFRGGKAVSTGTSAARRYLSHEAEISAAGRRSQCAGIRQRGAAGTRPADSAGPPGGPGMLLPGPAGRASDHAAHARASAFGGPAVVRPPLPGLPPGPGRRGRGDIQLARQGRRRSGGAP
jgi:CBS domain-containing protein